jgi:hypothetical protein
MFIMPKAPILSPVKMAQRYGTVIRVHISSKEPTGDDEPVNYSQLRALVAIEKLCQMHVDAERMQYAYKFNFNVGCMPQA